MGLDYKKKYLKYKNKYLEAKKIYGGSNLPSPLLRANTFSEGTAKEKLDARDVVVDSNENATKLRTAIVELENVNIDTKMIEKLLDDYDKCKNEDKDKKDKIAQMLKKEYIETFPGKNKDIDEANSTEEIIEVIIKHAIQLNQTILGAKLQDNFKNMMNLGTGKSPVSASAVTPPAVDPATATVPAPVLSQPGDPSDAASAVDSQSSASAKPLTFTEIMNTTHEDLAKEGVEFSDITAEQLKSLEGKKRAVIIQKLTEDQEVPILKDMSGEDLKTLMGTTELVVDAKTKLLISWVDNNNIEDISEWPENLFNDAKVSITAIKGKVKDNKGLAKALERFND